MRLLLKNRLLLQLLFTFAAGLCLAALSVLLVREAINNAERVVVGEAHKAIAAALAELKSQYRYRASFDSSWPALPAKALDVSLRGITQTVLRSYSGVEGGFCDKGHFLGYAFPTHDTGEAKIDFPIAEAGLIQAINQQSVRKGHFAESVIHGKTDLLLLAAEPAQGSAFVWAMKRLPGRSASGFGRRQLLLAVLVIAALISIVGTLATGLALARGVAQIKQGLAQLEQQFEFTLPERLDELGSISSAINRMAAGRRNLEAELRREDRLRAVGRLAAGLAHEIRNPLNSIRLTIQLLERRADSHSIRREDLKTVRTEVDRLSVLLNDLLDLQRSRQANPKMQPLLPVVEHCIELVNRQAEMQETYIRCEAPATDVCACFDAHQLTQTLVNLLLNALEASPAAGTVFVTVSEEHGTAHVEVRDEGPGLNAEQRDHLFEPFYTTKPNGTGLGLAVSRELLRSQNGDIRFLRSESGARFVVDLSAMGETNSHADFHDTRS
jgi:signal transduction histidine kinase